LLPVPAPPPLAPQVQLPPAPGVLPLALASIVPLMVASPSTAMMTGRVPIKRSVLPLATVNDRTATITTSGPLLCCCRLGTGAVPHQLVKVAISGPLPSGSAVSIVVTPLQSSTDAGCALQLIGLGSKLVGANARQLPVCSGSSGQPSMQFATPSLSSSRSGTPQPHVPGAIFAGSLSQVSLQFAKPSLSESVSAMPQPHCPASCLFASLGHSSGWRSQMNGWAPSQTLSFQVPSAQNSAQSSLLPASSGCPPLQRA
jgi:hypothetical protein